MDPARAQALQAALGHPPTLRPGDALPPFFHQIYFWTALTPDRLGRDGHPARGEGVIPDLGLPRRMWAGGRLEFRAPLRLGEPADLKTELVSATSKQGRTGRLGIVQIRLTYVQNDTVCIIEDRDLIYREDPDPTAAKPTPPMAPEVAESERPLTFDPTLLFRYSALTFNGHRIHYDRDYSMQTEGYGGLVVHGPLLAQHLMLMAEDELGPLSTFSFRATAPLMDFETATACRSGHELWIRGPDGRMCIKATAEPAVS